MRRIAFAPAVLAALMACLAPTLLSAAPTIQYAPLYVSSAWMLGASPTFDLPLIAGDGGSQAFSSAWGASLTARRQLQGPLSLRLGALWSTAGTLPASGLVVDGRLTELSLIAGAGYGVSLLHNLSADAFVDLGGGYGIYLNASSPYVLARAGLGLDFLLAAGLDLRLEGSFAYKSGLYAGPGLGLGVSYNLPESKASVDRGIKLLEFRNLESGSIFPILRSYYDEHPFGKVLLVNKSKKTLSDLRVSFLVKTYMDAPKDCASIASLGPGESIEVPLTALFNEEMLKITEPTKVAAELGVTVGGAAGESKTVPLTIQDRTALTWDDDRKAAAFVSSKDPWVLDLVGNFNATIKDTRNAEVPKNLQTAMVVHEGLRLYGIGYLLSPSRHFAEDKALGATVDNLKFPRQTLSYRSGDCADLSVLYASCLEAMSIETAFITIPGHIFMAVDLGLTPAEAAAHGIGADQVITQNGRVWVPIETTIRDKGFSEVWQTAMKEWQDASAKGVSAFYPMHEAWQRYAPVGLPADGSSVVLPAKDAVLMLFRAELDKQVQAELSSRIAALGPLPDKGASPKLLNERGTLYGRYGLLDSAERDFKTAAKAPYQPAIVNLGTVAFLRGDASEAFRCFKQAQAASPNDPKLLVNLAKAAAVLGKSAEVNTALAALGAIDPQTAARYSGLAQAGGTGLRAAEVGGDSIAWF